MRKKAELDRQREEFEEQVQNMKEERERARADGEDIEDPEVDEEFDMKEKAEMFDEENPPFNIPYEIEEDLDNDYNFEDE